jgi:hypothetical protein
MADHIQGRFEYNDHLYEQDEVYVLNQHLQYRQYADLLLLKTDIYKKDNDFLNIQNRK